MKSPASFRPAAYLRNLGPGLITAALVFGPGSLTVASKLGAAYAYQMVWLIPVSISFMIVFTQMSARIGWTASDSLVQLIRHRYGTLLTFLLGLGVLGVTASFQAGNATGAGLAFSEMLERPFEPFVLGVGLLALGLLFTHRLYQVLEKIMLVLVGTMLVAFLITLWQVAPDWGAFWRGWIPHWEPDGTVLVVAMVASSFSVVGAFFQGYLVQEKSWKAGSLQQAAREPVAGILILGLLSLMVMASAGQVLYDIEQPVNTAADMARVLQPAFGEFTQGIFLLGLFGASFSSLMGNATIGGTIIADTLGWGKSWTSTKVRACMGLIIVLGTAVALIFGGLPLELIVFAQGITVVLVPLIGLMLLLLANDRELMQEGRNRWWQNTWGITGLIVLILLAAFQVHRLWLSE